MRLFKSSLLAGALLVTSAAPASALERYAAPDGATSGTCEITAPCRIDVAVNAAPTGADVIVPSGDYAITTPLDAANAITLRGTGPTRPRLIDTANSITVLEFREGGSVRHLEILASGPDQDALSLEGATGEDLLLRSENGDAAKIVGAAGVTVLRDTVAVSAGSAALKLRDASGQTVGDIALVNVTAYAPAGVAVRCETDHGTSSLINTIARGRELDISATTKDAKCTTSHSSFRPSMSPGLGDGAANRDGDPTFVHEAGGNLHLADGSPLLDAGTTDPRLGATDPDGDARIIGAAPDIGAYEGPGGPRFVPPAPAPFAPVTPGTALVGGGQAGAPDADGDGTPDVSDPTPAVPAAVIGRTVVVLPSKGTVVVRPPGATSYTELDGSTFIPTGSIIDTRRGTVSLSSVVDAAGTVQTGEFRGGLFEVRQSRTGNGMTDLVLRGGDFGRCAVAARTATASAKKPVRRLWAKDDRGRFRTHGRNSVATARGTAWLTEDTCAGTRTRVSKDSVSVKPTRGGKARIVRAGRQLLVRTPRKLRG